MAIVDDADRLSIAAQNALLKTLEEPPGQALLLLVTASPGALLTTVRSRCQRVAFRPLPPPTVASCPAHGRPGRRRSGAARRALADGSPGRALGLRATWRDADRDAVARGACGLWRAADMLRCSS